MTHPGISLVLAASLAISIGCGNASGSAEPIGVGPSPALPEPDTSLIPTINVVEAIGWAEGGKPVPATGTMVTAFARQLDHPRWLHVLPNGDVLVAETNAPERPDHGKGIKGFFFKYFQKKAGGAVPSANRITLLRDADGNGEAEVRSAFLTGLNSPFGMAPNGMPLDVLTGFVSDDEAMGRPVGVAIDSRGGLLVADDVGNAVWRVGGAQQLTRR